MAKSFVCDLSGEQVQGPALDFHEVELNETFRIRYELLKKVNQSGQLDRADLGPLAAVKIAKAIQKLDLVKPVQPTD